MGEEPLRLTVEQVYLISQLIKSGVSKEELLAEFDDDEEEDEQRNDPQVNGAPENEATTRREQMPLSSNIAIQPQCEESVDVCYNLPQSPVSESSYPPSPPESPSTDNGEKDGGLENEQEKPEADFNETDYAL